MKALITGVAGFVGSGIARRLLEKNHEVHGIVRASSDLWRLAELEGRIQLESGDLTEPAFVEEAIRSVQPDVVFHLASHGTYPRHKDEQQIHEGTVVAAEHVFRAAKRAGVQRVVNAGTSSEYGRKDHPMREDDALEPETPYGRAKAAQTRLAQEFSRTEGLPIVTLRLFSPFGPFEDAGRLFPNAIKHALRGEDIPIADPSIARDFMYIEDVADGFLAAGEKDLGGEIINLSTGTQHTLKDVYDAVISATGSDSEMAVGAYQKRVYDTDLWVADTEKMRTLLGTRPRYTLAEGVEAMVKWFPSYAHVYENIQTT